MSMLHACANVFAPKVDVSLLHDRSIIAAPLPNYFDSVCMSAPPSRNASDAQVCHRLQSVRVYPA